MAIRVHHYEATELGERCKACGKPREPGRSRPELCEGRKAFPRVYRCALCGCFYTDHGPSSPAGQHRRIMAALRVPTWDEAEARAKAGARVVSEDPSWEGQECGDQSAREHDEGPCPGQLVRVR